MAGRPPLRIGEHGKIVRKHLGDGVWLARTRFRDSDGVTRRVERTGSSGPDDKYGLEAENVLIAALQDRRPPSDDEISLDTEISVLVDQHLARLTEDGRSPATISTYQFAAGKLSKFIGSVRVGESTPKRIDAAIRSMKRAHGVTMARQSKTILRGALQLAVMADVLGTNPVLGVGAIESSDTPKGATALTAAQLRDLLGKLRADEYCISNDLVDPITVLMATGLRRSELLALRWVDYSADAGTVRVAGKVVRGKGTGLQRLDKGKTDSSLRTVPLPRFAATALSERRGRGFWGEQKMIFPSTAGTWRDPNNFGKQWRKVRENLGVGDVTSHSFRKSMADLIDEGGMAARVAADQLGHAKVSMTTDRYMSRGKVHTEVAALMDRTINSE